MQATRSRTPLSLRSALTALALVCGGSLLGSLSVTAWAPPAAAQQARGGWEYRVFRMDPADYHDKADYQQILQKEGPKKADAAFTEHVLDYLGSEGWELIQVERRAQNLVYLYLKRPAR